MSIVQPETTPTAPAKASAKQRPSSLLDSLRKWNNENPEAKRPEIMSRAKFPQPVPTPQS